MLKKKIKIIAVLLAVTTIGSNNGVYADETMISVQYPITVWHEDITQFAYNTIATPTPEPIPEIHKYEQIVSIAKQYLGIPYVWGGTSPSGFDCSGLVQYVYCQLGVRLTRTTYTQVNEGTEISKNNLRQGDLVFFKKNGDVHHVGIYIGNNQYIHAPQTGEVVKISNLSDRNDYYTARRIIND